jgi:hypothetical protein
MAATSTEPVGEPWEVATAGEGLEAAATAGEGSEAAATAEQGSEAATTAEEERVVVGMGVA